MLKMRLIVLFICLLSSLVFGAKKVKTLKVACYNYPPYMIEPGNESVGEGINIEVLRLIFKQSNYDIKIDWMPFSRALHEVEINNYDALCAISKFNSNKLIIPSEHLAEAKIAIWKKKARKMYFDGIESLKGRRIGMIAGFNYVASSPQYQKLIDENPKSIIRQSGNLVVERLFKMLLIERIDVVAINYEFASFIVGQKYIDDNYEILSYHENSTKGFLGIAPQSVERESIIKTYNHGLKSLRGNKCWNDIYKKYMNIRLRPKT